MGRNKGTTKHRKTHPPRAVRRSWFRTLHFLRKSYSLHHGEKTKKEEDK